jgi:hypothetical protein
VEFGNQSAKAEMSIEMAELEQKREDAFKAFTIALNENVAIKKRFSDAIDEEMRLCEPDAIHLLNRLKQKIGLEEK